MAIPHPPVAAGLQVRHRGEEQQAREPRVLFQTQLHSRDSKGGKERLPRLSRQRAAQARSLEHHRQAVRRAGFGTRWGFGLSPTHNPAQVQS